MNSSIAASMMASRRSAARAARLEAGLDGRAFAEAGVVAFGARAFPGLGGAGCPGLVLVFVMSFNMTDQSVNVNWNEFNRFSHRRYLEEFAAFPTDRRPGKLRSGQPIRCKAQSLLPSRSRR
jgi:hypothetical protein